MFSFLFKKGLDKRFNEIHTSVRSSFSNIREDMSQVTEWISHFKERHDSQDNNFQYVLERLTAIEEKLVKIDKDMYSELIEIKSDGASTEKKGWHDLTDLQQSLTRQILGSSSESSSGWVSLRVVGEDLYPDKDYARVRTTIAQYVKKLEELGFIERKKTSRDTFVRCVHDSLPNVRTPKGQFNIMEKKRRKKRIA